MGQRHDLVRYELGFIVGAVARETDDFVPGTTVGEKILGFPIKVISDDRICGIQNVLGGAVVLLQQYDGGARKIPFKLGDVADVGTAERINRLVRITHHREGCARNFAILTPGKRRTLRDMLRSDSPGELTNERVLCVVGVLVFVHQNMAKTRLVFCCNLGKSSKEIHRLTNQVIKVERL